MGDVLRSRIGIKRRIVQEKQSLSFGFNVRPAAGGGFGFAALNSYGERRGDGIDYLNFFPAGGAMRANLFTFRDFRDPWVRQMRTAPAQVLSATLPGLAAMLGPVEVDDRVQTWLMDLVVAENVRQPGIVLVGDAYQTSCPAAGTGVSRLLTDVERLAHYVPRWLATPGMGADKIAAFYADAEKQAMDARALALAHYRRSLTIETSWRWQLHRQQLYWRRRALAGLDRLTPGIAARLRQLRARPA
jgi:2-polyprenyl-6-methoxyphenol hydroxylase-like FAD-dependent oxidoreductase